ncbi:MAG: NADH-quinone oxidoreductase subunit K [Candidatus Bipolaricaulota bacterium]|nr:MAG: NADH-quinone oxidoreductase subunit K [Candidatus Bipolaricaulota bacterium]
MTPGVVVAILLFGLATVALVLRRDLVFKLLALGMINGSTVLLLVSLPRAHGTTAPIGVGVLPTTAADPFPQAYVLAAIVINFALLALALVFVMLLVERYHTTDARRIERLVREEEER